MPLLDSYSLSKLAQALQDFHKLFQCIMAFRVELAVLKEFVHGLLLAPLEHLLEEAEGDLSYEELIMVSIMALHLGALSRNLRNTVVIRSLQLIKLRVQIVPFLGQSICDAFKLIDLSIILVALVAKR